MKLEVLRLKDIKTVSVQSGRRTEDAAMRGLVESFDETGFLVPPVVLKEAGDKYFAIDGHRRLECATRKGLEKVACVVISPGEFKGTKETLFGHLNRSMRRPGGVEWQDGWSQARNPEAFIALAPKTQQRSVAWMRETYGETEAKKLIQSSDPPATLHKCTTAILTMIATHTSTYEGSPVPSQKEVANWIMKHRAAGMVPRLIPVASKKRIEKLRRCIAQDCAYKLGSGSGSVSFTAPNDRRSFSG